MTDTPSPFASASTDAVHLATLALLACEDAQAASGAGQAFVPRDPLESLLRTWDQTAQPPELAEHFTTLMSRLVGAGATSRVCVEIAALDALLTATRQALPPGWRSYYHHRGHA